MEMDGSREIYILRRMKRESIGHWAWNAFNPMKGRPEELKFKLLDGNERNIGELVFGEMGLRKGAKVSTPWGPAKLEWPKMHLQISINELELVRFDMSWLGGKTDLVFHDGAIMRLSRIKGRKNDINFSDEKGWMSFTEETGRLPEGGQERGIQLTKEEIMQLPKADRPKSVETSDYVQYRIAISGTLPVKDQDVVAALTIFAGFMRLLEEVPR